MFERINNSKIKNESRGRRSAPDSIRIAHAVVQPKLSVAPADDPLEREADQAADRVVNLWQNGSLKAPEAATAPAIMGPLVQRRAVSSEASALQVPPTAAQQIQAARGAGQALPVALQPSLEAAFGMDFSGVRLHTDARADGLNRDLRARAFATGQDIFFRQGEYRPGSTAGMRLLAHELEHVGQQREGRASRIQRVPASEIRTQHPDGIRVAIVYAPTIEDEYDKFRHMIGHTVGDFFRTGEESRSDDNTLNLDRSLTKRLLSKARSAIMDIDMAQWDTEHSVSETYTASRRRTERVTEERRRTRELTRLGNTPESLITEIDRYVREVDATTIAGEVSGLANARPDRNLYINLTSHLNEMDYVLTENDIRLIAISEYGNDLEFKRQGIPFAQLRRTVGLNGAGQLEVGIPIFFRPNENPIDKIAELTRAVAETESPAIIRELYLFTHGTSRSMTLGSARTPGGRSLNGAEIASRLTIYLRPDVGISLFGCSAADESNGPSFARRLTEGLAESGHNATVFGHTTPEHTTRNPYGQTFVANAGETSATLFNNFESIQALFPADLRIAITTFCTENNVTEPSIIRKFINDVLDQELLDGREASYTIGYRRQDTLDAIAPILDTLWTAKSPGYRPHSRRRRGSP
jgi:hypothetical protein